jgi:hypothetical protein
VALAAAEAERVTKVGLAEAEAIEKQAAASGGARYQLTRQIAEALERSKVDIVRRISVAGGGDSAGLIPGGPLMQALMTLMLAEKAETAANANPPAKAA